MAKQILIVGAVAAGLKAASRIRRLDAEAQVRVFDRSEAISYGACALPYYIEKLFPDLDEVRMTPAGVIRDSGFFGNVKGVDVRGGYEAVELDTAGKRLKVRSQAGEEEWHSYDQLILATGNYPVMPKVEGIGLEGVAPLKTMADAAKIDAWASCASRAVIVGGGLIGLETAEALRARGVGVTLLEARDQVLPAALDPGMAGLIHRELKNNGVNLRLSTSLDAIVGEKGRVSGVRTTGGMVEADLVVMAIGVRPEVSLARSAGLTVGPTGAIAVDPWQQTSDPCIWAAGDCAESTDILSGRKVYLPLGSTANRQGRAAAGAVCGRPDPMPGTLGSLIVKVFGLNAARTGLSESDALMNGYDPVTMVVSAPDRAHIYPGAKPITIRLVADRNSRRLLGGQIVGPGAIDKRIDVLATALHFGATVDQVSQLDLAYAPPFSSAMDPLHQAANALRNKLDGLAESMGPVRFRERVQEGDDLLLLDVRSPAEVAQVRIPGALHVPLGQLRKRIGELPKDRVIVPYCKLSLRGYEAARILVQGGLPNVAYLEGGILGWPFELETGG